MQAARGDATGGSGAPRASQRASAMGWICSLTSKTLCVEGGWGRREKCLPFFFFSCLFPSIFKYMLSSMESGVCDQRGEPFLKVLQSPPSAVCQPRDRGRGQQTLTFLRQEAKGVVSQ